MEFFESSPKGKTEERDLTEKFKNVPVGKSFVVKFGEYKEGSLRTLASRAGKDLNRSFRVIKHSSKSVFEVARNE